MDFVESARMAWFTLKSNVLRTLLTTLGITIGIAAVIMMVGLGRGAQSYADQQFQSLGANLLFVLPGAIEERRLGRENTALTVADAEAVALQVPTVVDLAPAVSTRSPVVWRGQNTATTVIGTTPSFPTVRDFSVAQGQFFTWVDLRRNSRVVLLGSEVKTKLFGTRSAVGETIRVGNENFIVIGVMAEKGTTLFQNLDDLVFIPLTTVANRLVGKTSPQGIPVQSISVEAAEGKSDAARFQITNLLRLRHRITSGGDDFTIASQNDLVSTASNITGALTILLAGTAGISLMVGGIGIMNIMLVSVRERTREIGIRKAVGATQRDILLQFVIEAAALAGTGGIMGTVIGLGACALLSQFTPLTVWAGWPAVALAVAVSVGIGLFFGIFPARQAARLDPIVALRAQ